MASSMFDGTNNNNSSKPESRRSNSGRTYRENGRCTPSSSTSNGPISPNRRCATGLAKLRWTERSVGLSSGSSDSKVACTVRNSRGDGEEIGLPAGFS